MAYERAIQMSWDQGFVARELDTTRRIIDAFQRHLVRIGDTTYIAPRMGAGQWMHRLQSA